MARGKATIFGRTSGDLTGMNCSVQMGAISGLKSGRKCIRAASGFLKSEALHPLDFTILDDGVVRLNPDLWGGWLVSFKAKESQGSGVTTVEPSGTKPLLMHN